MAVWEQFILKFSSLSFTLWKRLTLQSDKYDWAQGKEKYDLQHFVSPFGINEAEI